MLNFLKKSKVNWIIRILIISDFFLLFAVGLLAPIFAIFILEAIDNKIEVVGYAVACYWVSRVIMVVPISRIMDRIKGQNDEYLFMAVGTFMIGSIPLFYMISSAPWHIYLLQIINGLAHAMAVSAWRIVFTKNVDRHLVGYEWSLEDVSVGLATASSAAIGALIASKFGFHILFWLIFIFGTISSLILLTLTKNKISYLKKIFSGRTDKTPIKIGPMK